MVRVFNEGYDVDDDNAPAPDNVPNPKESNMIQYDVWGSRMICNRVTEGPRFEQPKMPKQPSEQSRQSWFKLFLPEDWMKTVILLPEMNDHILGIKPVDWPKLLRFIGLLLLMATVRVGYG